MSQDSEDLDMQIAAREGKIVLLFSRKDSDGNRQPALVDHFSFPARDASDMMQMLGDLAFEIDGTLKPAGDAVKVALVQRHKDKLVPRIAMVLQTLREDKKLSNGQLAIKLIDIIFSEVFS